MIFKELNLKGVFEIKLNPIQDERGFFVRTYDKEIFQDHSLPTNWTQESHALSKNKGTIRGLHFLYPPSTESKLITMIAGEGFWVFLDVRKKSPTLGQWGTVILGAEKHNSLFIPKGFANAVCTLTNDCHALYHMDAMYDDTAKSEIKWNDSELNIPWPIQSPSVISERDKKAQSFEEFLEKSGGGISV